LSAGSGKEQDFTDFNLDSKVSGLAVRAMLIVNSSNEANMQSSFSRMDFGVTSLYFNPDFLPVDVFIFLL
jgi:hypothetical protein